MVLAIIGDEPARLASFRQYYREVYQKAGRDMSELQLSINSHVYVSDSSKKVLDEFYPPCAAVMTRIGRERGWRPSSRQQFEVSAGPKGALLVGSPQQVVDEILYEYGLFGNTRFLSQ
jgi:alkanesulfonate monooxygenase SsuD/methylene tetrahydromethanopterin reductase-like flavin-dependent oxidoreductase (luciferase family)